MLSLSGMLLLKEGKGFEKMNILIVHNHYQISGGEDMVVNNEKRMLEKHGHKVVLYSRHNAELETMSKLKKVILPLIVVFNPKTYKEIKKIIKKEAIDIVHVHNTIHLISPSVYYAARYRKVPVVQTIHNFRLLCPSATFYRDNYICEDCLDKGLKCSIYHSCYRNSKLQTLGCTLSMVIHRVTRIYGRINYICLTNFNKEKLLRLKQIKKDKVFIKPNFIDISEGHLYKSKRKNQFIFAGRLDKLKGVEILFKAWKEMGTSAPKLVVCGTGPMENWCDNFIKENNLNIEMKGFVSNEKIKGLIACSKALILPTQWYEGFPLSIVEAFSVGTPVIGSNLGNVGSIIKENVNGMKINPTSIKELISAINTLNISYEQVWDYYNLHYTETANYKILMEIYRRILE